jgi:hypothetical protein
MATTIKLKRKSFANLAGIGKSIANTWNSGALGKAKVIGGATAAVGGTAALGAGAVGAAKFGKASKQALAGEMGDENL